MRVLVAQRSLPRVAGAVAATASHSLLPLAAAVALAPRAMLAVAPLLRHRSRPPLHYDHPRSPSSSSPSVRAFCAPPPFYHHHLHAARGASTTLALTSPSLASNFATSSSSSSSYSSSSRSHWSSQVRHRQRRWAIAAGLCFGLTLIGGAALAEGEESKGPSAAELALEAKTDGDLFAKVYPKLEAILTKMDVHDKLPSRAWLWGEDQRSNVAAIEALLDEVIVMLRLSDLNQPRQVIRKLDEEIRSAQKRVSEWREQRISAPLNQTMGMDSLPGYRTKQGYDELITKEQANIEDFREQQKLVKTQFKSKAKTIGLDMSTESLDALLDSVSGDDLISMGIVFKNVKTVTTQLEKLTNQSGEALEMAQRYYGMYVVLLKTLDRMQKNFIREVDREFIPKLQTFSKEAQANVKEAQDAIKKKQGDAVVLENNIKNNSLTQEVAATYVTYLREQKEVVRDKNNQLIDTIVTAVNTYKTVSVSRNVSAFLAKGNENFSALMSLSMPPLRAFENERLRTEFQGLTQRMQKK